MSRPSAASVSIVIPVLNEMAMLKKMRSHHEMLVASGMEVIFVDGGSKDGSLEWLKDNYASVVESPAGRAKQMNAGASAASGDSLIFLHVDTYLPTADMQALFNDDARWGYFDLELSSRAKVFRVLEFCIRCRSKYFKVATGDQVLFFEKSFFEDIGGFKDIDLMEDIEISRRAKTVCSPTRLKARVVSSSRRWEKYGVIKTVIFMWYLQLLFKFGVSTSRLNYMYRKASWRVTNDR